MFITSPTSGFSKNVSDPKSKFFNKSYYDPNIDFDEEIQDDVRMFGNEKPDELEFTDVWESAYSNLICPEYFYHFFFCSFLYTFEPEVTKFFVLVVFSGKGDVFFTSEYPLSFFMRLIHVFIKFLINKIIVDNLLPLRKGPFESLFQR